MHVLSENIIAFYVAWLFANLGFLGSNPEIYMYITLCVSKLPDFKDDP